MGSLFSKPPSDITHVTGSGIHLTYNKKTCDGVVWLATPEGFPESDKPAWEADQLQKCRAGVDYEGPPPSQGFNDPVSFVKENALVFGIAGGILVFVVFIAVVKS